MIELIKLTGKNGFFSSFCFGLVNLDVFLAQNTGLKGLLAVGADEVFVVRVAGHVASDRTESKRIIGANYKLKEVCIDQS